MDAGLAKGTSSLGLLTLWRFPMSLRARRHHTVADVGRRNPATPPLGYSTKTFCSKTSEESMFLRCYFVCSRSAKPTAATKENTMERPLRAGGHAHWLVSTMLMAGLFFSLPVGVFAQSVLVAGGQVSPSLYTNTAEVYNPATGAWSPTANTISYDPPPSVAGLCAPNMALLGNGQVLIAGGGCGDAGGTTNAASLYNPITNQWSATPTFMNYGRDQFGMLTLHGGNALAFAGCAGGCIGPNILKQYFATVGRSAEIYGFATGQWTTAAQLTTARGNIEQDNLSQSAVELQDGRVLACNGSNGFAFEYTTCEIYDPVANTWTLTGSMLGTETGIHQMALLGSGKVLTVSTADGQSAFLFDPNSGVWNATNSQASPQFGGQLLLLADGRVLDCGGTLAADHVTPVNTAQIYDPTSGTWSATGPMGTSRQGHIAVRLGDGKVLVAGGETTDSTILSSAEIFDPIVGTWSSTTSMTQARAGASALLLGQAGPFAYVANMNSSTVSMIDIPSSVLVNTIPVGSGPWGVAISPDQKQVYVTNNQGNSLSIIDTKSATVVHNVLGLSSPLGVAFTPNGSQAYVVNGSSNSVSVIDTTSQTVVKTVVVKSSPVGVAMALTSVGTFAFVTNSGSNSVSVITVGSNPTVLKNILVGTTPVWVAVTPDSKFAYVEDAGSNDIKVISVATKAVVSTIPLGVSPNSAAFSPNGTFAYVTSSASNSVLVIDTASAKIVSTVPSVNSASQVARTADGSSAFVTNQSSSGVSVINTANNTISGTVTVGTTPIGVAIATAPLTELQITQPLSPTQPNTFTFGTANYAVQYPAGTQFSNVNMTIKEVEITQAEFQQRVVGTNYASAACIVYGGTGGNCVDHQVTCSDNNGTPINCPTASAINVQTSFMAPQSVVNPGYLTTPIGQNQWQNIFSEYYAIEQLITVKGRTTGFSEFVAVDLGASNPQGQAQFQILSPTFPVIYSQGQVIPISFQLTSVVPPNPAVADAQASISVVMIANANGNPVQQVVFSKVNAFLQGNPGVYNYSLDATAYAAGTYSVTIYGNAFPSFQGQFAIQAPAGSVVLASKPTSLMFPGQYVGTLSAALRDSLFNSGSVQGIVSSVQTTGDFQIQTNHCMNGVKPGTHCDVFVTFLPTALGPRTGTLFYNDNAQGSPQPVSLSGVGTSTRPTTTTLSSSPNPSAYGKAVTFTAVVSSSAGAPPDGETVSFMKGTTLLGTGTLSGGSASFMTSTLLVGTDSITAVYAGDSNFAASKSKAVSQVVNKATTTTSLVSSQNPSNVGQSVTFTATVTPQFSGTAKGSVTFYDGTTALKTVALSGGVAKFTTSTLTSGAHSITATYNGSTSFTGSSASLTQTVN